MNFSLDRTQLKRLAIIAMVVDHTAWGFVRFMSPLGQAMHIFGRLTLPIMCFFIAEGYRHTSDLRRYIERMVTFAAVSVIPFYLFFHKEYYYRQNIIFDLTLALLALAALEKKSWSRVVRGVLFAVILTVSILIGGWIIMPIIYVIIFYYGKTWKRKCVLFTGATVLMEAVVIGFILTNRIYHYSIYRWTVSERIYLLFFVLALIPLSFYNGKKGKDCTGRYFFYCFYPAHFMVLWTIRQFLDGRADLYHIYIAVHLIGFFVIGVALAFVFFAVRPSRAQSAVALFLAFGLVYVLGFLLEITSSNLEAILTATRVEYAGLILVLLSMALVVQELCHIRVPYPVLATAFTVSCILMYGQFTTGRNGLFYNGVTVAKNDGPFPHLYIASYGPLFYTSIIYAAVFYLYVVWLGLRSSRGSNILQKKRMRYLLIAFLFCWLPIPLKLSGLTGQYEFPAIGIAGAAIFISLSFVKYQCLDSMSTNISNAMNHGNEGIIVIDSNERILYHNESSHAIFGKFDDYTQIDSLPLIGEAVAYGRDRIRKDDKIYEIRTEPVREKEVDIGSIIWIIDLTSYYDHLEEVEIVASTDSLTGIKNRVWFEKKVMDAVEKKTPGTFMMIDLDNFKKVNDTYGHQSGDDVLKRLARVIMSESEDGYCGRIGGDEFCVFIPHVTSYEEALKRADVLIEGYSRAISQMPFHDLTSMSVGAVLADASSYTDNKVNYSALYREADRELYRAKQAGKGICFVGKL
ncbi:MAG: diguanylate cyclase [Eubacterium sp.]|nr:diguanylate cyclase [Eubacterium sp.]